MRDGRKTDGVTAPPAAGTAPDCAPCSASHVGRDWIRPAASPKLRRAKTSWRHSCPPPGPPAAQTPHPPLAEPDLLPGPRAASTTIASHVRRISARPPRTVAPASRVSATIRALSSSGRRRRPPNAGSTSSLLRVEIEVSIQTLTSCPNRRGEPQIRSSAGRGGASASLTVIGVL